MGGKYYGPDTLLIPAELRHGRDVAPQEPKTIFTGSRVGLHLLNRKEEDIGYLCELDHGIKCCYPAL